MSRNVFWWTCNNISEVPAAFLVLDTVRIFEIWVHSYNTNMCHIPEDSNPHCNCCGNLTSYNTSVECWYNCLWFHLSRAQGWIIQIKEFKNIQIAWWFISPTHQIGNIPERFFSFLIQPVLILGTSVIYHSLLNIHPFACFDYTVRLFCILRTVCFLSIILKQWILLVFLV
jgi:hypothetical protein